MSWLRRLHFRLYLAVLLVAPLPFGLNRPLPLLAATSVLGLLALTWPIIALRDPDAPALPGAPLTIPGLLFAGALAWAGLQTIQGVPLGVAHPIWLSTPDGIGAQSVAAIAADPDAARSGLVKLIAYGLAFYLAAVHGGSRRRAGDLVDGLALAGGAYALYGLIAHYSGSQTILWYDKWAYLDSLTGTFVNRNSYAAFAGLTLLCALAAVSRRLDGEPAGLAPILKHAGRRTGLYMAAAALIVAALLASGSRAGVMSSVLAVALFAAAKALSSSSLAGRTRAAAVGLLAAALAGLWLAVVYGLDIVSAVDAQRLAVYRLALDFIAERPLLGHGLGAAPSLLQMSRGPEFAVAWQEIHNSYLEILVELGLVAGVALLAAPAWLAIRLIDSLPGRAAGPACLALAASLQIALHSTIDFVAQIPAVGLVWLSLLGTATAQSMQNRQRQPAGWR